MKCSNCGNTDANFLYTEIVNGVKREIKLCTNCAQKLGFLNSQMSMPSLNFSNFFGDFLSEYDNISLMPSIFTEREKALKCTECGTTYDDFLNHGFFGCSNCYNVFESKIEPLLKQLHGNTKYFGKKSSFAKRYNSSVKNEDISEEANVFDDSKKENNTSDEIFHLKEELKEAIKTEDYENAAKIRDKIKEFENVKNNSESINENSNNKKRNDEEGTDK